LVEYVVDWIFEEMDWMEMEVVDLMVGFGIVVE